MKKLISTLSAMLILTSVPSTTAFASKTDNPDLYTLASSLGADTDYLDVVNFAADTDPDFIMDRYHEYFNRCSVLEAIYAPMDNFASGLFSGSCLGISLLEILSHNGIISPDDIQKGTQKLSDIKRNDYVDSLIAEYQLSQCFTIFDNYEKYLVNSQSVNEMVDSIIETAEKCMSENRYFLINIRSADFSHSVCGIGIADGEWQFENKTYDKCVLTLDSNMSDSDGNAYGFCDESCIYINTQTNELYIPDYKENIKEFIYVTAIDNDDILNYKGMINPTEKLSSEYNNYTVISYNNPSAYKNITWRTNEGDIFSLHEPSFQTWNGLSSFEKCDSVHYEVKRNDIPSNNIRYVNEERWIDVTVRNKNSKCTDIGAIDISNNEIKIDNYNQEQLNIGIQIRMNDNTYDFVPYYRWYFSGNIDKDIEAQITSDGIILKSDGTINLVITPFKYIGDKNGKFMLNEDNGIILEESIATKHINTKNNILLKFNENGQITSYFDDDNDGVYDIETQKGDVTGDGIVDASDASLVLSSYAYDSILTKMTPLDPYTADFNNDGVVDAIDASAILTYYAESSVK